MELEKIVYTCFPGGKHKVLTMSYDDGRLEDRPLVEIFNRNGIRGTFNLNAGLIREDRIPKEEYQKLYRGHEVACHTYQHPTIARCPITQVATQMLRDRQELEAIMGYPVRGLAYPNGSLNDDIVRMLPSLGIRYGRVVGNTDGFAMPEDFMKWKATCHHNHNLLKLGEEFLGLYKSQYLYMMYVWGHSYEFPRDDNWELMEKFCSMMGRQDNIWYATNIEIVDYMEAAKRLICTVDMKKIHNPNFQSVWISIDGESFEIKGGETLSL